MLTRWRARRGDDRGVTLMELIVGMSLTMVLGTMTTMIFISISNATAGTNDRTINSAAARNALQSWTAYLQVADGPVAGSTLNRFEWISSYDVMFHADLYNRSVADSGSVASTGAATMVWIRRDSAGSLIEEQFPNTAPANTAPTICRVLVRKVVASPLFTPIDKNNAKMSLTALGTPPANVGQNCQRLPITVPSLQSKPDPAATANLQNVSTIGIAFSLVDSRNGHAIAFASQATLPILGGSL